MGVAFVKHGSLATDTKLAMEAERTDLLLATSSTSPSRAVRALGGKSAHL